MNGRYRLDLIGPFGLFAADGRRIDISSKKAIALIALIISSPNGVRSRRWLQTMLWGSREAAQAQSSLRRELSNLSKLLDAHGAGDLLIRGTQRVGLAIDQLDVDVFSLGLKLPTDKLPFSGELLEGLDLRDCEEFEDWLRAERERIHDMIALSIPEASAQLPSAQDILGMDLPTSDELLSDSHPRLPPKPSVGVLPFDELTVESRGWLGAGLADEIGVILSQFPQLFIVAGNAVRALSAAGCTKQDIASRLGVRYLIDGTVALVAGRLRVSVMLIEGQTGEQVWAESFGGSLEDSFAIEREIANRIAPQIWTKVDTAERHRVLRHSGPAIGNYQRYWRANALFRSWQKEHVFEAINLTDQMIAHDPTCPWAASLAAYCHAIAYMLNYAPDREATRRTAIAHYQTAVRFGEDNVEALGYAAGTLLSIGGDMAIADRLIAHALSLLPAHQPTLFWGGWIDISNGRAERARERFELALRINPASGVRSQTLCGIGFAFMLQQQLHEAYPFLLQASQTGPDFFLSHAGLCVVATMLGEKDVARVAARQLNIANPVEVAGLFSDPQYRDLFTQALKSSLSESLAA